MAVYLIGAQLEEAVTPSYREILLLLIAQLTNNPELKEILSTEQGRKSLVFHHIDSKYKDYGTRKQALNNDKNNLVLLSRSAHQKLSNAINKANSSGDIDKVKELTSIDYIRKLDNVYPLKDVLPSEYFTKLEPAMDAIAEE